MFNKLLTPVRTKVSADRNRFIDQNYNLDMAFINKRIIAMGLPGQGLKTVWRNNIDHVAEMLNNYYPSNYMIWNLSEFKYDYSKFDNQIMEFGFPDHHNPPLVLLFKIILSMDSWLKADPKNICVVHCVGGKGRTGTVISCYLLYSSNKFADPKAALDYFGKKRSKKNKGVTQPSQKRYVHYFFEILQNELCPYARPLKLVRLIITCVPCFTSATSVITNLATGSPVDQGCRIIVRIWHSLPAFEQQLLYQTPTLADGSYTLYCTGQTVVFNLDVSLKADILITCHHATSTGSEIKVFRCAFHTAFIEDYAVVFKRDELDDVKKNLSKFDYAFSLGLVFSEPEVTETEIAASKDATECFTTVFQTTGRNKNAAKNLNVPFATVDTDGKIHYALLRNQGTDALPNINNFPGNRNSFFLQGQHQMRPGKPLPATPPSNILAEQPTTPRANRITNSSVSIDQPITPRTNRITNSSVSVDQPITPRSSKIAPPIPKRQDITILEINNSDFNEIQVIQSRPTKLVPPNSQHLTGQLNYGTLSPRRTTESQRPLIPPRSYSFEQGLQKDTLEINTMRNTINSSSKPPQRKPPPAPKY
eukprot:TRINITY_DN451_c0_g1_i2.p1 TRINITY_DN451_c0_g1~~TRINITY_DN451_c0_g1_i2.p1  ORF type:complete len:591 (-),score=205.25 TRINITY_DN451_c0_g1_i2:53-1825(-)